MASFIPEHKIDEVRNAANIVEVVSSYVNLKRAGRLYRGLCPFHAEKTPSFNVNPERQIFHCFGCGVGGNVFRFLMLQKGVSFPEAVTELAERFAIDLPRVSGAGAKQTGQTKTELYQAVALSQKFFENELQEPHGENAREYLAGRGLSRELIRKFHMGWAPDSWDALLLFLSSKGVKPQIMDTAGLVKRRTNGQGFYDRFRARIICPIFDLTGKPIAFGGRLLKDTQGQPKYLNSPETPIYQKGRVLYGMNQARSYLRDTKTVIIVEGYFDLLALMAYGVHNVVATLGTALTPSHLRLLKGYVDEAFVVFDSDEAGRAAAARSLPLFLSADLEGRVLLLPEGHDPDTFINAFGREEFDIQLKKSVGLLDFFLDQTLSRYPKTLAGKSRAAQAVMEIVSEVKGEARQNLLRRALAHRLDISEEALRLARRRKNADSGQVKGLVERMSADFETELLRLILLHPEVWQTVFAADLGPLFSANTAKEIFITMSRLFDQTGEVNLAKLLEMINPDLVDLASSLALSEDGLEGEDLSLAVTDLINSFKSRDLKRREAKLSQLIKEAQEARDIAGLKRLLSEKNQLLKVKTL
ncbi:MAG: DNA primase [Deltaproteobacteria bacterium]|nr:DNA primase [Deltaproteobacteria bacterium]MBW2051798.1 DNA primase [Deltaproteobacteria bacterium]MBW2139658.1 DNA primase [Deltaproteobacteria bacterium]MBW2322155.1 DNA primase [Deltaproteobacteria bacterium]